MSKADAAVIVNQALSATERYMAPDYPITPAGRLVVTSYRQAMRDWLVSADEPDETTMPQADDWSKYEYSQQQNTELP